MFRITLRRQDEPAVMQDVPARTFTIGRGTESEIVLDSPLVSMRHAIVEARADGIFIRDCRSRNGTFVNDRMVEEEQPIGPEDRIQICDFTLHVRGTVVAPRPASPPPPAVAPESDLGPPPIDLSSSDSPTVEPTRHVTLSQTKTFCAEILNLLSNPAVQEVVVRTGAPTALHTKEVPDSYEAHGPQEEVMECLSMLAAGHGTAEIPVREFQFNEFTVYAYDSSVVTGGPTFIALRDARRSFTLDLLRTDGQVSSDDASFLRAALQDSRGIVVCGGTAETRRTLMEALALEIPSVKRRVVVHRGRIGPRLASETLALDGRSDASDLVRAALRLRPDWLVILEIGGREVAEALGASRPGAVLFSTPALSARAALASLQAALGAWSGLIPGPHAQAYVASCFEIVVAIRETSASRLEIASIHEMQGGVLRDRAVRDNRSQRAPGEVGL